MVFGLPVQWGENVDITLMGGRGGVRVGRGGGRGVVKGRGRGGDGNRVVRWGGGDEEMRRRK